ncbi:MAG: tRNA (N6-isopentenyl adenosine(37)-C2)-methylthiotransferase MiaB [Anaerolineaceae bacterium]|jgi:tRNA-2-methylthio-N6-dimethylallyladenosine synthase
MKYYLWTEGCQMNVADSQHVASALDHMGYRSTPVPDDADVIVLNTCVVRQSAEDKAYGRLSSLRKLKSQRPEMVICLMGCLVGVRDNPKLRQRFPYVDVFAPPSDPSSLIEFLGQHEGRAVEEAETAARFAMMDGDKPFTEAKERLVAANVPIVLGCSHACTYCIIPYRRGAERSREPQEIFDEVTTLVSQGVREVTLLGQIVDRYGKDHPEWPNLTGLIRQLHTIDGLERIRFLTSHPNWMTDELMDAVAELPKVMPHIEVPAQAGDDEVLANMRRGYTADEYRVLIERIRGHIPAVSIGTDIIVGFPGETEAQFQNTYNMLAELKLDVVHLARYSPRPQTVSARTMEDNVPAEEKWRRFRLVEELQAKIVSEIHAGYVGRTVPVLLEEQVKGRWKGRTPTNKLVFAEAADDLCGQIKPVTITRAGAWSMNGSIAG